MDSYLEAVQKEMSYMGGNGKVEYMLWKEIKYWQKQLRDAKINFPSYDSIECNREHWF